jgi:peptidoglycan/LPS O-acetylase OafA/YrhL
VLLNIIKSLCYAIIIYDQAFNTQRLFNLGKSSTINYLGKISYGLYLYHALVITTLAKTFHFFDLESQRSLSKSTFQMLLTFFVSVAVAHLSYQYIELKFLSMKIKDQRIPISA